VNDNVDGDDKVLSFPIEDRLKQVEKDRAKDKPIVLHNWLDYKIDPNITVNFDFDGIRSSSSFSSTFVGPYRFGTITVPPKDETVDFDALAKKEDNDRVARFMDNCHRLQKRAMYHYAKGNSVLFGNMETLLAQLNSIADIKE
jgi:hypothetical protein